MKTILKFLRELEMNNNKPWFDSHKNEYLEARSHFNALVEQLLAGITSFDDSIRGVGVNDCTYRIYKDMRFSKDGLPYKTHFGAFIARGGRKSGYSGYYFHIGTGSGEEYPCRSFLAVGNYYTEPKVLRILREDIELGGGDFDRIIKNLHPSLSLDQDQKLKRAPLGFNAEGPYIDYIKLKNFCLSGTFDDSRLDIDQIVKVFRTAKPFLDYINRAIEFSREEPEPSLSDYQF
ncbi:MAG: DUF2461 domain-containing protein [Bacteroidales bacterium]|nr:DUF2461 domain-containing protein [Bacteroidales bacterium]